MAGFDDVLKRYQPSAAPSVRAGGTAGRTWRYELVNLVRDDDGVLVALAGAEYTAAMEIVDASGEVVASFTVQKDALGPSSIVATLTDAETAVIKGSREGTAYAWRAHLTRTVSGVSTSIQLWGGLRSTFTVTTP